MLRRLLASLGGLAFGGAPVPRITVVVVDNDAGRSAEPVVRQAGAELPWPVVYCVEPERNISLARNRGIARALSLGADFVAFLDDDERVHPGWLGALLSAQRTYGAEVVSGPAVPRYDPAAPAWLVRAGLSRVTRPRTGTPVAYPNMYNALVSARLLRGDDSPFDPAFGLTGGGDSLFFTRCHRTGVTMVAADEALVEEWVPASRSTPRWVLQRAFRVGNAAVRVERSLPRAQRRIGARVLAGGARFAAGALGVLPAAAFGRAAALNALWNLFYGAGVLSAMTGYEYVEYRNLHGE